VSVQLVQVQVPEALVQSELAPEVLEPQVIPVGLLEPVIPKELEPEALAHLAVHPQVDLVALPYFDFLDQS
jgi:hypothetical protein